MRRANSKAWLLMPLVVAAACQQRRPTALRAPTGIYVGLEEMKGMPPEKPGDRWYHENIVYIRPDSLYLEGNPLVVSRNGEKGYSASDGGFYSYSGRLDTSAGKLVARLRMFAHDYLVEPIIINDSGAVNSKLSLDELVKRGAVSRDSSFYWKVLTITPTAKGFEMGDVRYIRLPADSLPNIFPVGFPDSRRFLGKAAGRYGR